MMKVKDVIFEDDIVVTWQKEDSTYEVYRYTFYGYPNGDADYAVMAPQLPEWILKHAESFRDNSNVAIMQITEFTEDDFKHLLALYEKRHPDSRALYEKNIKDVIRTPDITEHWLNDYIRDFIGDEG